MGWFYRSSIKLSWSDAQEHCRLNNDYLSPNSGTLVSELFLGHQYILNKISSPYRFMHFANRNMWTGLNRLKSPNWSWNDFFGWIGFNIPAIQYNIDENRKCGSVTFSLVGPKKFPIYFAADCNDKKFFMCEYSYNVT
jgi:hypothetical protein